MINFARFICRYLLLWVPVFFLVTVADTDVWAGNTQKSSKITAKEVEAHIKGLRHLSADFIQQNADGSTYTGHIYISKETNSKNVRVDYEESLHQRIFIKNDVIKIIDLDTKKEMVNSISQTPIYSILNCDFDLSKENYSIDDVDSEYAYCTIHQVTLYGKTHIKFIFSRYENGNIKYLEGWIIEEPNGNIIIFNLLPRNMFVNDKSKIPESTFENNN